jgi:hypothetical protein
MADPQLTMEELFALPPSVDIITAGRAFGIGRTKAHELARADDFPCKVLRLGTRYRVPRSAIFEALGIDPATAVSREPQPAT